MSNFSPGPILIEIINVLVLGTVLFWASYVGKSLLRADRRQQKRDRAVTKANRRNNRRHVALAQQARWTRERNLLRNP